ncbi:MAG: type II toxin-antitoxin system RelE/ParE family toxin [Desulfobulbaceae bacterium]|nr:type II toxin-antitoxin system RelE/ParE family toxin [Desulfobulbaceae bacterium]
MKVVWSPLAIDRVAEIAEYIAQDNSTAAENWVNTVFARAEGLGAFPQSGRIVPEISDDRFRELICGNYRIIYRIEESRVSILTIRHGKQILPEEEL